MTTVDFQGQTISTDMDMTANGLWITASAILRRGDHGKIIETPEQMCERVADCLSEPELRWGGIRAKAEMKKHLTYIYQNLLGIHNSPALVNAWRPGEDYKTLGQLFACFVLEVPDSIDGIAKAGHMAARIFQTGGGVGYYFGDVRPKGDDVSTTHRYASGHLSVMEIFQAWTNFIMSAGYRRGASMGVYGCWGAEVLEFVRYKRQEGRLTGFNISVLITDAFMEAVKQDAPWQLLNPRDGAVWATIQARELWDEMLHGAYTNGEPGFLFYDAINKDNPVPQLGPIQATNPCAEVPQHTNDACVLGHNCLHRQTKQDASGRVVFDYDLIAYTTRWMTRALDNSIEMCKYPFPEIEAMVKGNRKLGLGILGLGDALMMMGLPYNSPEARDVAGKVMRHIADIAREESHHLALERGSFLHYKGSLFDDPTSNPDYAGDYAHQPMRNATLTAIAPTGTTSAIAGSFCSGIEPAFANAFMREQAGGQMIEFNPYLDRAVKERGLWYDGFHADVHKAHGSVANMTHLPDDMRAVFVTAHDIAPLDHVEMQAVIQENGVDLATSKTINFGESAAMEEIAEAVVYAHSRGIKGLSIYRDNSRAGQTYSTGDDPRKERIDAVLSHAVGEGFTTTLGRDRETYTITLRDATAGKAKFTCTEEGTHHYITEGGCIRCVNHGISACPTL